MAELVNRRTMIGIGGAVAATAMLNATPATAAEDSPDRRVRWVYGSQSRRAGGTWNSYLTVAGETAIEDKADELVEAYSVNKVAVATAVLDKVDRGLLKLDQRLEVTDEIVIHDDDGIFGLDGAYPSSVTIGHALAMLLTVSDNTSVRLCGLVCPSAEINEILAAKGFPKTQVKPVANPNRFYLGKTTPREMHDLLKALVGGTLLSAASTAYLLKILRSPVAFTDGIRRTMSSAERARVATKAGWFADGRNEAGIMFDAAGKPVLIYSIFAHGQADADNFGATHPALEARAVMGRAFFDAVQRLSPPSTARAFTTPEYRPSNGG
ncbi:serine hydrolase [Amycolatopsis jejuensis]|uniref:serine hydrolase n=1 Tax=Amycolatopsis jejuensis TaxID=330084 RepID=UPI000AE9D818|nr:serine hydrolase [Amycolatopsis jejuensis]